MSSTWSGLASLGPQFQDQRRPDQSVATQTRPALGIIVRVEHSLGAKEAIVSDDAVDVPQAEDSEHESLLGSEYSTVCGFS